MSQQRFPNGRQWTVDIAAFAKLRPLVEVERIDRELAEMAQHFPRWVLSVSDGHALTKCPACGGVLVFDGGVRCVACERAFNARKDNHHPAWFGLLPPIGLGGLTNIKDALVAKPPPGHVVGEHATIGAYLLVPLIAVIPAQFPHQAPAVHYLPTIRAIAGMPQEEVSHAFHMLSNHQMCLYASGEWTADTTCRETLQQRAFAHVVKLLNFANGKKTAFAIVS
jgi:hypothetical protein